MFLIQGVPEDTDPLQFADKTKNMSVRQLKLILLKRITFLRHVDIIFWI